MDDPDFERPREPPAWRLDEEDPHLSIFDTTGFWGAAGAATAVLLIALFHPWH